MHQEILKFWFEELEPKQWWVKDLELDQFESLQIHEEAVELFRRNCQQGKFAYELKHKARGLGANLQSQSSIRNRFQR
jgi:hypothetical protein